MTKDYMQRGNNLTSPSDQVFSLTDAVFASRAAVEARKHQQPIVLPACPIKIKQTKESKAKKIITTQVKEVVSNGTLAGMFNQLHHLVQQVAVGTLETHLPKYLRSQGSFMMTADGLQIDRLAAFFLGKSRVTGTFGASNEPVIRDAVNSFVMAVEISAENSTEVHTPAGIPCEDCDNASGVIEMTVSPSSSSSSSRVSTMLPAPASYVQRNSFLPDGSQISHV